VSYAKCKYVSHPPTASPLAKNFSKCISLEVFPVSVIGKNAAKLAKLHKYSKTYFLAL
jgi:hypothetical protein